MEPTEARLLRRRQDRQNIWLERIGADLPDFDRNKPFEFSILENEGEVGRAMFGELLRCADEKDGDITLVLLGGRGAQALYRIIRQKAEAGEIDALLARLNVFTQDALAPMRMANGLSFVRDFERLLGDAFFSKVKTFTPMLTETDDIEGALIRYLDKLESLGGIDLFMLGFGPEAGAASHLCYIKPDSGAMHSDEAGIVPISPSILEHHISKFKAGGSEVTADDEKECRAASHILTLGPRAILNATTIVQSIVDASTAPAKRESFARMVSTVFSTDDAEVERQLDANPGLWIRVHPNVRSFVLSDLLVQN